MDTVQLPDIYLLLMMLISLFLIEASAHDYYHDGEDQ